jgi:hypothetical protein
MRLYLGGKRPFDQSPRNLLALRFDCHLGGFDRTQFVFVPKWGKLAVHFLNQSSEFANQYHNIIFDHGNTLSQEALYTCFAWAVLKLVANEMTHAKKFTFVDTPKDSDPNTKDGEGDGKGGGRRYKRKREDEDEGEEEEGSENDEDAADQSGTYRPGQRARRRPDVLLQGPNAWLSDVLSQLDNGYTEGYTRELKEDMGTAARLPFLGVYGLNLSEFVSLMLNLVNSNIPPTADQWELPWYPGVGVVEKLKKQYIASHPNIQALHLSDKFQSNSVLDNSD